METDNTEYVEILGIYPGMHASKFRVRNDSWQHYIENYLNSHDQGNCFIPARDQDGDTLFVDMTKLLAFYVLTKPDESRPKTTTKTKTKTKKKTAV